MSCVWVFGRWREEREGGEKKRKRRTFPRKAKGERRKHSGEVVI